LRLALANLLVVAAGLGVFVVTVRLLVPRLFDDEVGGQGSGAGVGRPPQAGRFREIVVSSLNRSLVIAALIGLAVAAVAAWFVARRIVRPIDRVRATTRALAEGQLHERVDPPSDAELAALAEDVNVLADHLERTEERRRHLVTELGHELRTPITTITGFVEGFQDGVIEPTPEVLAELGDEVRRLERLTADLGLLSRLDEGQVVLDCRRIHLGDVAASVVARLRPQFAAGDVALSAQGTTAPVDADPDRVAQVLTNLVGNALRYTPAGGHVDVRWWSRHGDVWCSVADDGRGLAADELTSVFDRFVRGSASAGTPGTGVGLAVARSLARAHGGDVTATSPGPERGATFVLRLPAP
jgi:histidine kinase